MSAGVGDGFQIRSVPLLRDRWVRFPHAPAKAIIHIVKLMQNTFTEGPNEIYLPSTSFLTLSAILPAS